MHVNGFDFCFFIDRLFFSSIMVVLSFSEWVVMVGRGGGRGALT